MNDFVKKLKEEMFPMRIIANEEIDIHTAEILTSLANSKMFQDSFFGIVERNIHLLIKNHE